MQTNSEFVIQQPLDQQSLKAQATAYVNRNAEVPVVLNTFAPVYPAKSNLFLRSMNIDTVCAISEKFSTWASEVLTHPEAYADMSDLQVVCDAPGQTSDGPSVKVVASYHVLDACFIFGFSTQLYVFFL